MTMLERVAFTLFVRRGLTHSFGDAETSWERSKGTVVGKECMDDARAVLAALREPTDGMKAAWHRDFDDWLDDKIEGEYHMWQTMIDAALEEGKDA